MTVLSESQKEAAAILFKKLLSDRNKTLEELQYTQASLQKHIPKIVKKPNTPRAAVAFSLLEDLIDECISDVLFDVHRDIKREKAVCQICQTKCKHYVKRPGCDIWGKNYTVNNLPSYECVNCQKSIASTRYAPHLEKCLGLSGRQSSRVASRRIGTGSPSFSSDDNAIGSPDNNDLYYKKKKQSSYHGSPALSNGSRVKKLKYEQ
ncbi:Ataxin-7-like protein 3 [Choanephora cucurbitarum]|uniref:SAGA-associated factor 11 n=1 Tax=Choanephora cucurbitarum TaxID=101091 RepID=A0A1C7NDL6_9FUNG|nr:Ataxin-7-like protein 3 [Choanephora cucurbitarum]